MNLLTAVPQPADAQEKPADDAVKVEPGNKKQIIYLKHLSLIWIFRPVPEVMPVEDSAKVEQGNVDVFNNLNYANFNWKVNCSPWTRQCPGYPRGTGSRCWSWK